MITSVPSLLMLTFCSVPHNNTIQFPSVRFGDVMSTCYGRGNVILRKCYMCINNVNVILLNKGKSPKRAPSRSPWDNTTFGEFCDMFNLILCIQWKGRQSPNNSDYCLP